MGKCWHGNGVTELTSCKVWEPRGKLWEADVDSRVTFNIRPANLI